MPVRRLFACLLVALAATASLAATSLPSIADKTAGVDKRGRFLPLYWDASAGKMWLEIGRLGDEILYYTSLPQGVGSNDIGLDRGQIGAQRVVRFERSGPKVLLIQTNYAYRADTSDAAFRETVEESFASSTLWGFDVVAETDGRVLVDATSFFLSDQHDVAAQLERTSQGKYALEATRSAFRRERTKEFPKNTEVEATLTFTTSDKPGAFVTSVAPNPRAVTV